MNENGANNYIERAERDIRMLASYGLSSTALDMKELVEYTKSLERNQSNLIKAILKVQRQNRKMCTLIMRMYHMMSRGQKNIVDVWVQKVGDAK